MSLPPTEINVFSNGEEQMEAASEGRAGFPYIYIHQYI